MAIVLHQHRVIKASSPNILAFSSNNLSGSLLVALTTLYGAGSTCTFTDSHNTWSTVLNENDNGGNITVSIGYAKNSAAGANTVTATWVTSNNCWLAIYEYTGIDTSAPLDQSNSAQTTSGSSLNTGNVTTGTANELLIGCCGDYSSAPAGSWTASNSFGIEDEDDGGLPGFVTADRIVSSTGTYSTTFGGAGAGDTLAAAIATFKAASAATHSLFRQNPMTGLGDGGPFFSDPLAMQGKFAYSKRSRIFVPERYAA